MKIYLVGGAVRDKLLNLSVSEEDYVVVGSSPEEMIKLGFKPVGKDFPVFLHPKTHAEYALARTERKTGRGYQGFQFYAAKDVTLEQDLIRRDLTINAIAMSDDGNMIDPFGGINDLNNKILRHVSDAFIEDPVRLLRLARFYARLSPLGFTIAPETKMLLSHMVQNGEINHLVAERVWQEMSRALQEEHPEKFFELLRSCDALNILIPELNQLFGVPNPPKWHPEIDSGIHSLMVLKQASLLTKNPLVRFAAIMHDLGKGLTNPMYWPKHHHHEEAGVKLVKQLCLRWRVPKEYAELAILATRYHGLVHKIFELRSDTLLEFLEKIDAFRRPERAQLFLLACEADAKGRPGFETKDYPQKNYVLKAMEILNKVDVAALRNQHAELNVFIKKLKEARVEALESQLKSGSH